MKAIRHLFILFVIALCLALTGYFLDGDPKGSDPVLWAIVGVIALGLFFFSFLVAGYCVFILLTGLYKRQGY